MKIKQQLDIKMQSGGGLSLSSLVFRCTTLVVVTVILGQHQEQHVFVSGQRSSSSDRNQFGDDSYSGGGVGGVGDGSQSLLEVVKSINYLSEVSSRITLSSASWWHPSDGARGRFPDISTGKTLYFDTNTSAN